MTFPICAFPVANAISGSFVGVVSLLGSPSSGQTSANHSLAFTFDTPNTNRWLIAEVVFTGVGTGAAPARALSVTIGGVPATQLFLVGTSVSQVGYYAAKVPTNANQTVGLTFTASSFADANQIACALYDVGGVGASLNASNPPGLLTNNSGVISGSTSVPANSLVIGGAFAFAGSPPSHTWIGIVADAGAAFPSQWSYSVAHKNFSAAQSLTVTDTSSASNTIFGSFIVISA